MCFDRCGLRRLVDSGSAGRVGGEVGSAEPPMGPLQTPADAMVGMWGANMESAPKGRPHGPLKGPIQLLQAILSESAISANGPLDWDIDGLARA